MASGESPEPARRRAGRRDVLLYRNKQFFCVCAYGLCLLPETPAICIVTPYYIFICTGGAQVTRQYGIKVSSWGSETFKIMIRVENHHQKSKNRLAYYHPLWGGGVLISGQIYVLTIYVHIGVVNSRRHDSPHIRKSSLDHDSAFRQKKTGGVCHIFRYIPH